MQIAIPELQGLTFCSANVRYAIENKAEFMELINQLKRNTLKIMAASGLAAASPLALSAMLPATDGAPVTKSPQSAHLKIDILAGNSVPDDSIVLRNTTTDVLQISAFHPGVVACKDMVLDLNTLCRNQTLILQPGQVVSTTAAQWQEMAASESHEYLVADDSVTAISADTDLVSLLAVVDGNSATVMSSVVAIS